MEIRLKMLWNLRDHSVKKTGFFSKRMWRQCQTIIGWMNGLIDWSWFVSFSLFFSFSHLTLLARGVNWNGGCRFGTIISTKAILDKNTNKCKGYGFVDFESPSAAESAVKALQLQGIQAQMAKVIVKVITPFFYFLLLLLLYYVSIF